MQGGERGRVEKVEYFLSISEFPVSPLVQCSRVSTHYTRDLCIRRTFHYPPLIVCAIRAIVSLRGHYVSDSRPDTYFIAGGTRAMKNRFRPHPCAPAPGIEPEALIRMA